ncbi:VOC family protein [Sulfobacillus harzensis]|uniref:VOC domain-containing protein n=1 Tax=Sulfobacillus harzensis TaxID=2729629 RepID=A0A7Y0L609_9FIRM|nr:VOC family protein [Sulfobacillus harzensis]NMP23954.1 hypothetical protein [Sulfobacillus harzensis]
MGVGQVSIFVTDLEVAKSFFSRVLGLEVKRELRPLAVELHDEHVSLLLHLAKTSHPAELDDVRVSLGFPSFDIYESLRFLNAEGVDILTPEPQYSPFGPWIAFRDPFGNILELVAFEE